MIKLGDFPAGWRADKSDHLEDPCHIFGALNQVADAQADFTMEDADQAKSGTLDSFISQDDAFDADFMDQLVRAAAGRLVP